VFAFVTMALGQSPNSQIGREVGDTQTLTGRRRIQHSFEPTDPVRGTAFRREVHDPGRSGAPLVERHRRCSLDLTSPLSVPEEFDRISSPDANRVLAVTVCLPQWAGGDRVTEVFVLAQAL